MSTARHGSAYDSYRRTKWHYGYFSIPIHVLLKDTYVINSINEYLFLED